mmetsp:Transcript_40450/g.129939  ORF Transcript_40450/g.129939 Transcript_40450/m.129939 type:complete len:250 (-) Transcript_40450:1348-2097(-)
MFASSPLVPAPLPTVWRFLRRRRAGSRHSIKCGALCSRRLEAPSSRRTPQPRLRCLLRCRRRSSSGMACRSTAATCSLFRRRPAGGLWNATLSGCHRGKACSSTPKTTSGCQACRPTRGTLLRSCWARDNPANPRLCRSDTPVQLPDPTCLRAGASSRSRCLQPQQISAWGVTRPLPSGASPWAPPLLPAPSCRRPLHRHRLRRRPCPLGARRSGWTCSSRQRRRRSSRKTARNRRTCLSALSTQTRSP